MKPTAGNAPAIPPLASASSERPVKMKGSALRNTGMIVLGILLAVALVWLPVHLFAGPKRVKFRAFVDGLDVVKISGHRLWMEHMDAQLPVSMRVNGKSWSPAWNDNTSAVFELSGALRGNPANIKLTQRLGRGTVSIVEQPSADNDKTLTIKIDDGSYGGADWYEFTISW
jgi:hypothetical protein